LASNSLQPLGRGLLAQATHKPKPHGNRCGLASCAPIGRPLDKTATLTGLGAGGIAVALAAQKTLENVIGGVPLIFDQARVGDTVRVGATQGIVEEIGMRSTRIRTSDRTVVSVPNGQIANMTLENLSSRDKFWFHPILPLRYGTTSPQMRAVLVGMSNSNRFACTFFVSDPLLWTWRLWPISWLAIGTIS
jgi:Mechanosensitive ion channel